MLKVDTPASGAATIAASTRPTGGIRKHRNVTCSCLCHEQKEGRQNAVHRVSKSLKLWSGYREKWVVFGGINVLFTRK